MISLRLPLLMVMLAATPALAAPPALAKRTPAPVKRVETRELIESISGKSVDGATPENEAILSACSAMKFETSVEVGNGDDKHLTKIKLCSKPGGTRDEWIATLGQAAVKIQANDELAPESRAQLVAAINAEIARLKS